MTLRMKSTAGLFLREYRSRLGFTTTSLSITSSGASLTLMTRVPGSNFIFCVT